MFRRINSIELLFNYLQLFRKIIKYSNFFKFFTKTQKINLEKK